MTDCIANSKVWSRRRLLSAALFVAAAAVPALGQSVTVSGTTFPVTRYYQGSEQNVTLTVNSPIVLQQVQLAPGFNNLDFSISQVNCTLGSLAAGTVCTVQVSFTPHSAGWITSPAPISRSAPLQIQYYDTVLNGPVTLFLPLTGTGQAPQGVLSPGLITDLIGNDVARPVGFGGDGGPAANAVFTTPGGITMDVLGNIYLADTGSGVIRLYYQGGSFPWIAGGAALVPGNIYTIAGVAPAGGVVGGAAVDGVVATSSPLNGPTGVAIDAAGNLYIADNNNNAVRMVAAGTGIITTVAGLLNSTPAPGASFSGDLGPAIQAQLNVPASVTVDGSGNIYIADSDNNALRVVYEQGAALASLIALEIPGTTATPGTIYTLAGGPNVTASANNGDGGLASAAQLNFPTGITVDSLGDVYIADGGNKSVRRVDGVSGLIGSIYAGSDTPVNLAVDSSDNIDFTLQHTCTVMQYNPSLQTNLTINNMLPALMSVAGNGVCMPSGDMGPSNLAGLAGALGVVVDGTGNLYVLEADGVRMVATTGTPLNFGAVNVGTSSAAATVVMTDDDILPYNNIPYLNAGAYLFLFGQNYTQFNYAPYVGTNPNIPDCNTAIYGGPNYGLNPGASCGASFGFMPTQDGGPFTNSAQSQVGPYVTLSGTGIGPLPTATLTGGPLNFNAIVNETTSLSQPFMLTNTSAVALTISQIYFSNSNFQETDTCGISAYLVVNPTLAPGKSCVINVTFSTNVQGVTNATINLLDNASSGAIPGTQTGAVSGTGLAPLGVVTTTGFPLTAPGGLSNAVVTLTNNGTAQLNINPTGYSITGNDPARFAITANGCGATLAVGANCKIMLSYAPLTYAYYAASLNVQDDSGGVRIYKSSGVPVYQWATQTLGINGTTGNPPIETNLTIGNAAFPPISVGQSETQNVTVTLARAAAMKAIAVTPGFPEYAVGAIAGCVVDGVTVSAAGTVCQVPVTFTPAAPGIRNAPLTAVDVENGGPVPYALAMTGFGKGPIAALTPGIITTVVGGAHGIADGIVGADGPATGALVGFQAGMAIDPVGQIFLADNENEVIWKTDTAGNIHIYAGSPFPPGGYVEDLSGDGGTAIGSHLGYVGVIALDAKDGLYLAETDAVGDNPRIRYVDPATGLITTAAGYVPPVAWAASTAFFYSSRIVITIAGTKYLFVAQAGGTTGSAQPAWPASSGASIADGTLTWQNQGVFSGPGCAAQTDTFGDGCAASQITINGVSGMTLDANGNVFFTDVGGALIRRIDATTKVVTVVAGNGTSGYAGDGGAATSANIAASDLAFDSNANLYFIDDNGTILREVTQATGDISTVAGKPGPRPYSPQYCLGGGGYGGPASAAFFAYATSLAIDAANNIYVTDNYGCVVSRIDAGTGTIQVVAGVPQSYAFYGNAGYGDVGFGPYLSDGDASAATLNQPAIVRLDSSANVYIASAYGGVRKVDTSQSVLNFTGWSYTTNGTPTPLDTNSGPQTATVLNAGNSSLISFTTPFESLPAWGISSPNYIRDTSSPTGPVDCYTLGTLGVGYECPVSVDFAPLSGSGYLLATDTVNDNAVASAQPIHLIGLVSGTPPLVTLTPFLLSFSTPQGAVSPMQPLTLTNNDVNPLPISSIVISGSGFAAFTQTNNCGSVLAAQSFCTIQVVFSPAVLGGGGTGLVPPDVLTAEVEVTDTAGNSPQISQLTGTGTLPAASGSVVLMPDNEGIHITDTVSLGFGTVLTINENITVSDSMPALAPATVLNITETLHLSDGVAGLNNAVNVVVAESIHVADNDQIFFPAIVAVMETVHVMDAPAFSNAVLIAVAETIHTADAPAIAQKYSTTTVLTATNVSVGSAEIFSAKVTSSGGTPTGSVSFYGAGGTLYGTTNVNASGVAGLSTTLAQAGSYSVYAVYAGDASNGASTSATVNFSVLYPSSLTLTVSPAGTTPGSTVMFIAAATSAGSPTGTVNFYDAPTATLLGSAQLGGSGLASYGTSYGSIGSRTVMAQYVGDAQNAASLPAYATVIVTNGNAPQAITFLLIGNLSRAAVPAITLTAHSNSGLGVVYQVSGPATLAGNTLTFTGTGSVTVTATQPGNAAFAAAASVARTFVVTP